MSFWCRFRYFYFYLKLFGYKTKINISRQSRVWVASTCIILRIHKLRALSDRYINQDFKFSFRNFVLHFPWKLKHKWIVHFRVNLNFKPIVSYYISHNISCNKMMFPCVINFFSSCTVYLTIIISSQCIRTLWGSGVGSLIFKTMSQISYEVNGIFLH